MKHPFYVLKNLLAYRKTRYRGLTKNTSHLNTLMGLVNLKLAAKRDISYHLAKIGGGIRPRRKM